MVLEERPSLVPPKTRAAAAVALVLSEYLIQAVLFDGGELARREGWDKQLGSLGEVMAIGCLALTAGIVVTRSELADALRACVPELRPISTVWCSVHLMSLGVSALTLGCVFAGKATSLASVLGLVLVWLGSGIGSLLALGRALFGKGVWRLLAVIVRVAMAGVGLGCVAWVLALHSRQFWPWLAHRTLSVSAWLLSLATDRVDVDYERTTLGAAGFQVEIAPQCSGIEGMALVGVFLAGYLYEFRRSLRFPRALALLPLAMLIAWFANAVRLAALVAVGAWGSSEIAFGGFHSKAGWILFCAITLSIVYVTQRTPLFSRAAPLPATGTNNPTAAYCLPLLAVLAVSLVTALWSADLDLAYSPRVICAAVLLWIYRAHYTDWKLTPGWASPLIGAAVFAIWLLFWPDPDPGRTAAFKAALAGLSAEARFVWIVFRIVGAVVTVPVIEELAFRGYLQRRLVNADFVAVPLQRVNFPAIVGSAVVFGSLHHAWIAGIIAGAAYSFASRRRGQLIDAIVAHATTNALIAVWVLARARWDLWL